MASLYPLILAVLFRSVALISIHLGHLGRSHLFFSASEVRTSFMFTLRLNSCPLELHDFLGAIRLRLVFRILWILILEFTWILNRICVQLLCYFSQPLGYLELNVD